MEKLELVSLSGQSEEIATSFAHGQQRLLCLAVALAANPELLLLDG